MNRPLALAVAALLTAGCIPDTKKLDPFASAASVCPVLFDAFTAKLAECNGFAPYLTAQYYAGALPSCAMIAAGEAAGRIGYDRAKAEACVGAFTAPGCSLNGACNDLPFVPRVTLNGTCFSDLECTAATAGCYPGNVCPGQCKAPGLGGAACGSSVTPPCGPSLYCDYSTSTPTCLARAADYASCASAQCGQNSYCDYSSTPYICRPLGTNGATCTGYWQCQTGYFCNVASGASTGSCQVASSASTTRCDYPNRCAASLWCDYTPLVPTCRSRVGLGGACSGSSACSVPGSGCIIPSGSSSGTCQLLKGDGAPCTAGNYECQEGFYCSSATAHCTRPASSGACGYVGAEYVQCAIGTHCAIPSGSSIGTCAADLGPGQPCPNYNECGSGYFGFSGPSCMNVSTTPGVSDLRCVAACAP